MKQSIIGFHQDEERHWVAELECGHSQHVRHNPPLTSRPWVTTSEGRRQRVGAELQCLKCDERHDSRTAPLGS
ncbi:MAG TPA: DUF3565 domain-containing protein [Pyrinomonadaceae bacterium]|nr:DUF3565 domain-containing protein [Pyrinomonadaceae bacterium]